LKDESFCNYCSGTNSDDVRYWEEWLKEHPGDREKIEEQKKLVLLLAGEAAVTETEGQFLRLQQRLEAVGRPPVRRLYPMLLKWTAAVLFLAAAGLSLYTYRKGHNAPLAAQDNEKVIPPASYMATLTLSDGTKIDLKGAANGRIASGPGSSVSKIGEGQLVYSAASDGHPFPAAFNTLTTPKGGHFNVTLPDGTMVSLNAASSLTYATGPGERGDRVVELTGEAYFDVKHDALRPFIVKASGQEIKDIGTSFNIRSYPGEGGIKTTLISGAVRVSTDVAAHQHAESVYLVPGQQAYVTEEGDLATAPVDTTTAVAWKNGHFYFKNADIGSVMREVSRWYDVDISYDKDISTDGLNGKISRQSNLSEILEKLSATGFVHFRTEGRKIIVLK